MKDCCKKWKDCLVDAYMHRPNAPTCSKILRFNKHLQFLLWGGFVLAILYNTIGLYFAVQGELSPLFAAILMPASSISVVVYAYIGTFILYQNYQAKIRNDKGHSKG